jgi:hypothetical protein
LHAATGAGACHPAGREALLRYVLRPAVAQERVELRPDGLVRITLKKGLRRRDDRGRHGPAVAAVSAGHQRAATAPHTLRYSGVLAPASPWRRSLAPMAPTETPAEGQRPRRPERAPSYRPWAQLLARTFAVDVLACPQCHGRMRLLAMVEDAANVARYLAAVGEATDVPPRSPGRGPPYWKSRVLRRQALGEEDDARGRWVQETA